MAWTTPRTWASGETVTGALLNTHLRDNLASLRNGNDHYVRLFIDSHVSIPNNTPTIITWTDIDFQVGSIWSAGTPTRLTAPVTGKYLVLATAEWRQDTNNLRNLSIVRNTGGASQYDLQSQGAAGSKSSVCAKLLVDLSATNYLEVRAFQSSGAALTLHGRAPDRTRVAMIFLGT